jgi:kumamolisin
LTARAPIRGSERPAPEGARRIGPADPDERIRVSVYVRPNSAREPDGQSGTSPENAEGSALTREEYAARFGGDPQELERVGSFGKAHGLEVEEADPGRRLIVLYGPIQAMERAFGVELSQYEYPEGHFRGHDGPATVPADLDGIVVNVRGLTLKRRSG